MSFQEPFKDPLIKYTPPEDEDETDEGANSPTSFRFPEPEMGNDKSDLEKTSQRLFTAITNLEDRLGLEIKNRPSSSPVFLGFIDQINKIKQIQDWQLPSLNEEIDKIGNLDKELSKYISGLESSGQLPVTADQDLKNGLDQLANTPAPVNLGLITAANLNLDSILEKLRERLAAIEALQNQKTTDRDKKIINAEAVKSAKEKFREDFGVDYSPSLNKVSQPFKDRAAEYSQKDKSKRDAENLYQETNIKYEAGLIEAAALLAAGYPSTPEDQRDLQDKLHALRTQINWLASQKETLPDQADVLENKYLDLLNLLEEKEAVYLADNKYRASLDKFDYRGQLENLKIKRGEIIAPEYRHLDNVKADLQVELKALAESLVAKAVDRNLLWDNLEALAFKTGLSEKEIDEIYHSQTEAIIAEAKQEINKNNSLGKTIFKALTKSGVYLGAGVAASFSTVASGGLGGFAIPGIIGAARIVDRYITEKIGQNKINKKVIEIKASKTEEDKLFLQNKLAAAISLKKKLEIEQVSLGNKDKRQELIDEHINEQFQAGLIDVHQSRLPEYKAMVARALSGLALIDEDNTRREAQLNKPTFFEGLKKFEEKIAGDTTSKKVVSTAALVGMGLAARNVPVLRQVLMGYAGYRVGAMTGDYLVNQVNKAMEDSPEELGTEITEDNYSILKRKTLDKNFQANEPVEYLHLKKGLEEFEVREAREDVDSIAWLNDQLEKRLQGTNKFNNFLKVSSRLAGSLLGMALGEGVKELADYLKHHNFSAGSTETNKVSGAARLAAALGSAKADKQEEIITQTEKFISPDDKHTPWEKTGLQPDTTTKAADVIAWGRRFLEEQAAQADPNKQTLDANELINTKPAVAGVEPVNQAADGESITISGEKNSELSKLSNEISNVDLKSGQTDSVWRSTEQIFKENAAQLGYKGDINDTQALNNWAETQTGQALANSGDIKDKVFEGNIINLEQGKDGHYSISLEKGTGAAPGILEHPVEAPDTPEKADEPIVPAKEEIIVPLKNEAVIDPDSPGVGQKATEEIDRLVLLEASGQPVTDPATLEIFNHLSRSEQVSFATGKYGLDHVPIDNSSADSDDADVHKLINEQPLDKAGDKAISTVEEMAKNSKLAPDKLVKAHELVEKIYGTEDRVSLHKFSQELEEVKGSKLSRPEKILAADILKNRHEGDTSTLLEGKIKNLFSLMLDAAKK